MKNILMIKSIYVIISFTLCFFLIKEPFDLKGIDIILLIFSASFMAEVFFLIHMSISCNRKPSLNLKKSAIIYFFGIAMALYFCLKLGQKNLEAVQYFLIFGTSSFLALLFSGTLKSIDKAPD